MLTATGAVSLLPQGKFFRGWYLQEGDGKNNVCQGINVTKQKYYRCSNVRCAIQAGLISPLIDDIVNKIYNKSDANEKVRMTQQIPVIMGYHEIDLIDTKQDKEKGIEKPEIGGKVIPMSQDQVFRYPDRAGQKQQGIGDVFMGPDGPPERSPNLELPEDQDPFQECIDIADMGIAGFKLESDILANQFRSQSCP
jgi:hypothetical protein